MKIFFGGATDRPEFIEIYREACAASGLDARIATRSRVNATADGARFVDETDAESTPHRSLTDVDFFFLFRTHPSEFTSRDVEALRRRSPLAPIAVAMGAYCAGERRSGESLPGVRAFYAGEWESRWRMEFERFFDPSGARGAFAASPLATEVDLLSSPQFAPRSTPRPGFTALVATDNRALRETFASALRARGGRAIFSSSADFASAAGALDVAIVDGRDFYDPEFEGRALAFRATHPSTPVAVALFAPLAEERARFETDARFSPLRIFSAPFSVDALLDAHFDRISRRESLQ